MEKIVFLKNCWRGRCKILTLFGHETGISRYHMEKGKQNICPWEAESGSLRHLSIHYPVSKEQAQPMVHRQDASSSFLWPWRRVTAFIVCFLQLGFKERMLLGQKPQHDWGGLKKNKVGTHWEKAVLWCYLMGWFLIVSDILTNGGQTLTQTWLGPICQS